MSECSICGERVILPYRCSYCGLYFCDEHRLPENHNCSGLPKRKWSSITQIDAPIKSENDIYEEETSVFFNIKQIYYRFLSNFRNKLPRLKNLNTINIIVNTLFLFIISLPIIDSLLLMWNSPMTFSRTILPKWWNIFPTEYPIPSINLLYVYIFMVIVFVFVVIKFITVAYKKYYSIERKIKYYY
jgi:hypothetical protein